MRSRKQCILNIPTRTLLGNYIYSLLEGQISQKEEAIQRSYLMEPIAIIGMSCRFPGGSLFS